MDIHLDPLGGWSGDMFVAALLDAFPEFWPPVQAAIASLQLGAQAECRLVPHRDHVLTGSRFVVGADSSAPSGGQRIILTIIPIRMIITNTSMSAIKHGRIFAPTSPAPISMRV